MAKVTRIEETKVELKGICLELTVEEAQAVRSLLGKCKIDGPTSELYRALGCVGIPYDRYIITNGACDGYLNLAVTRKVG